ncbi:DoxX family protein [Mucilaginibacter xinganensis]|uniref:DoxX family protein n=1 Tax=Mucilaginibacter xinganensis TaxID=1234841 RepID=A0A223NS80_9SPHI|nr:DoxX family membrane protein [Mucilaginibacter xinganensis]ASU32732.1 DoxX family protein [Mucilaginibacter xinganensis]
MTSLKKISLVILVTGYLAAGANHFRAPDSYIHIIPPYIPLPKLMNILAGFFEILFGIMLIFKVTRFWAAWGIILMLVAFLPVHIDMVLHAPFQLGSLYVTPLIAWIRLLVFQPLLILWAWWYAKE